MKSLWVIIICILIVLISSVSTWYIFKYRKNNIKCNDQEINRLKEELNKATLEHDNELKLKTYYQNLQNINNTNSDIVKHTIESIKK